jgi:hypothetical protein
MACINRIELKSNGLRNISIGVFGRIECVKRLFLYGENQLDSIEIDALAQLRLSLVELVLSSMNLTDSKLDSPTMSELRTLLNLESIDFSHNLLNTFKKEWLQSYTNLKAINLRDNNIISLGEDTFASNSKLKTIDLSINKLRNLEAVLIGFEYIKQNKLTLSLAMNFFTSVKSKHFSNLTGIESLNLSNNLLEQIDDDSFIRNEELEVLDLSLNRLSKMPSIKYMRSLKELIINNQSGRLTNLSDYQFERYSKTFSSISLDISLNNLSQFGNKTFCFYNNNNMNTKNINFIRMDFNTFKSINKCILKQLGYYAVNDKPVNIELVTTNAKSNEQDELCSCKLQTFLNNSNLLINKTCPCTDCSNSNRETDDCLTKTEYDCANANLSSHDAYANNSKTTKANEAYYIRSVLSLKMFEFLFLLFYASNFKRILYVALHYKFYGINS